jgi:hypothetical protein
MWTLVLRTYGGWETRDSGSVSSEDVSSGQFCSDGSMNLPIVAQFRPCPVELSIKVAVKDKATQLQMVQTRRKVNGDAVVATIAQGTEAPLKSSDADGPGWYTFTKPLAYVYGGQGPYVAR